MELVKGCGKEVDIVVNENGGKQSKTEYSLHLLDGGFLKRVGEMTGDMILDKIGDFFICGDKDLLLDIILYFKDDVLDVLLEIGEVLKEGAEKYAINNWRLIPQEEHLNHALIHFIAWQTGDTQDNHKGHFLTRLMMSYATEKSGNFSYTEYIG